MVKVFTAFRFFRFFTGIRFASAVLELVSFLFSLSFSFIWGLFAWLWGVGSLLISSWIRFSFTYILPTWVWTGWTLLLPFILISIWVKVSCMLFLNHRIFLLCNVFVYVIHSLFLLSRYFYWTKIITRIGTGIASLKLSLFIFLLSLLCILFVDI